MTVLLKQRDLPLVHTVARFWIPEVEHFSSPVTFTQAKPGSLPVYDDTNLAEAFDGLDERNVGGRFVALHYMHRPGFVGDVLNELASNYSCKLALGEVSELFQMSRTGKIPHLPTHHRRLHMMALVQDSGGMYQVISFYPNTLRFSPKRFPLIGDIGFEEGSFFVTPEL